MAFGNFKDIDAVLAKYPLKVGRERFLPDAVMELSSWFLDNLNFNIEHRPLNAGEFFVSEAFVYPFLQEAWKRHTKLQLWSHQAIYFNEELSGEPDYLISKLPDAPVSHLLNPPLLAVIETKKEDFTQGWGQCLAGMLACQKLNADAQVTVFGIVTSGELWRFGKLEGDVFSEHVLPVALDNPGKIMGYLDFILSRCEDSAR